MDIMGLSRRLFDHLGASSGPQANAGVTRSKLDEEANATTLTDVSALTERLSHLGQRYDVKALAVSDLIPLQEDLKQQGFIAPNQVRAQGLLPKLAYAHYEAGPMDVEAALEKHLNALPNKPAVLADYNEGKHLLNVVRNLASAREQAIRVA